MTRIRRASVLAVSAAAVVVLGAGTAAAAAPSVTINPAGVLGSAGRSVTVSGTYQCDPVVGGTERLMLKVNQSAPIPAAQAQNIFVVPCTGVVEPYAFTIPTISVNPLVPGPALGQASLTGSSGAASATQVMVLA